MRLKKNNKNDELLSLPMLNKRIYSLLGIAASGRFISSGEFMTEQAVKAGQANYVIVASDASENTKKKFRNMCEYYHVPIAFFGDKDSLGHAIGKEFRASLSINNEGICKKIGGYLEKTQTVDAEDISANDETLSSADSMEGK